MTTRSSTPVSHFCEVFNCKSITKAQYNALLTLEVKYGPDQLIEVINWAAEKDIPLDRAIPAIKTAIQDWKHLTRNKSPAERSPTRIGDLLNAPGNVFDQIRQESDTGKRINENPGRYSHLDL